VWYYEHPLPEGKKNYTKTAPIQFEEFGPLLEWWAQREENERAWRVAAEEIAADGYNLDRKNPNAAVDFAHLPPEQLVEDILEKERRILALLEEVRLVLTEGKGADQIPSAAPVRVPALEVPG
jgi:type I restriction enzyme M protein